MTIQFDDQYPVPTLTRRPGVPGPRGPYGLRTGSVMSILQQMPIGKSYTFQKSIGSVAKVGRDLKPKLFTARALGPKSCRIWRIE